MKTIAIVGLLVGAGVIGYVLYQKQQQGNGLGGALGSLFGGGVGGGSGLFA